MATTATTVGTKVEVLPNYVGGAWRPSKAREFLDIYNPATGEVIARAPCTPREEVDEAVRAAKEAFEEWRRVPPAERVQYLYKLKRLLEENLDELARTITIECGKTYQESVGELRRGIENVEVACGIPTLMQGYLSEDVARGIDEFLIRQPLGVVVAITPFNFPGMIPLWFLPYAIACGNAFVLKPSDKTPITAQKIYKLIEETGLPKGVVSLVNGAKETVDALLEHPDVQAVSFVGSTPVAHYVYAKAAQHGKRAQCQGGAKNPIVVLPDAPLERVAKIVAESAFGCAGQRCLAASVAIPVGEAAEPFAEAIAEEAKAKKVGFGLDEGVEVGPVIRAEAKARVERFIQKGLDEGAQALVDGRNAKIPGYEKGFFVKPTVLYGVPPRGEVARTEIFGPVLSVIPMKTLDEAIRWVNEHHYGNMACLFTRSGEAARKFRYEVQAGNVGINIGVAAPVAYFPFSGWKESFFGVLHGQGRDAVEFYTQEKVVIERWL